MAIRVRSRPRVSRGYRRLLVPVLGAPESEKAMTAACRLAAERHATVAALTVIEVPSLLPLDAHMTEEEGDARKLLARVEAIGDAYGVTVVTRKVRARDAATAILELVDSGAFELVVIGAKRRERASKRAPAFGPTVQHVLRRATCRVMLVALPPE
jgi:nucleotide-binding universal stress UspA family protein